MVGALLAQSLSSPAAGRIDLGQKAETASSGSICPKDLAELSTFARAKLKRTQRRKTLVAAFWKQADLPF